MSGFSVIVPARLASTRLPNKALADIGGKPMVVRTAEQAAKSGAQRVCVATDHADIQAACREHGIDCVMTAAEHASGTSRLAEAAALLGLADGETVVNVQGDEPLIPPALIGRVAAALHDSDCAMATAAHPVADFAEFTNPNCVKVLTDAQGRALYFSRAPIPYPRDSMAHGRLPEPAPLRHIGIYAYRVGFLRRYAALPPAPPETLESLEQLRALWHGFDIAVETAAEAPPAGVDTAADLARARAAFQAAQSV